MVYEVLFRERGHAWYVYSGLKAHYRRGGQNADLTQIKINGSKIILNDDSKISLLEKIASGCEAKYKIIEIRTDGKA